MCNTAFEGPNKQVIASQSPKELLDHSTPSICHGTWSVCRYAMWWMPLAFVQTLMQMRKSCNNFFGICLQRLASSKLVHACMHGSVVTPSTLLLAKLMRCMWGAHRTQQQCMHAKSGMARGCVRVIAAVLTCGGWYSGTRLG